MKHAKLALAVALPAVMLVGCNDETTYTPSTAEIDSATRSQINKDDAELKEALAAAKAKDPSVKDVYYSVNEKGEKELNIVREVKDPVTGESKASSDIFPLLGGMAAGMLIGNMMNSGGGYRPGYAPSSSYTRSYDDERRRKNAATSAYAGSVRSSAVSRLSAAKPISSMSSSTRSSGAFKSSSSSRSSSYSSGG